MRVDLKKIKQKAIPILKEAGVTRSSVFGSYARGDEKGNSDIDILIEPPEKMSLLGLAGLKLDLEEIFGKEVDIITYNSIHPLLKKYILKDQVRIL